METGNGLTNEELKIIDQAVEEKDRYEKTSIKCPRCGSD